MGIVIYSKASTQWLQYKIFAMSNCSYSFSLVGYCKCFDKTLLSFVVLVYYNYLRVRNN